MTEPQYCQLLVEHGKVRSVGPTNTGNNIKDIIENDKRRGKFLPRNGKYYTFRILDVNDKEIDNKFVVNGIWEAIRKWTKKPINLAPFRQAKPGEYADIKFTFRNPQNDERGVMTNSTLMYAYFPINHFDDPRRGLVVINPDYFWTSHGRSLPLYIIDPVHYTETDKGTGSTFDFDGTLGHELGHVFGLDHDTAPSEIMSTPYMFLDEFVGERSIYRAQMKYGYKGNQVSWFVRWYFINRIRSERDAYGTRR